MSQLAYEKICTAARAVPKGRVASYGQVAELAGLPGRARMVGKALGQAPGNQPVPWYRILRSNGQLAFDAQTESAQRQTQLLAAEGVEVKNNRVCMKRFQWQPGLDDLLKLGISETL